MSASDRYDPFPRWVLVAAGTLIGFSLLVTALAQWLDLPGVQPPAADVVAERSLIFTDRMDGAVLVKDAQDDNRIIHVLEPGSHNFTRAVMRGFARERRAQGVGAFEPFTLTLWDDGRLSLTDPATGRQAFLNAFGVDNVNAFASFLTDDRTAS
ncbi:MAG: photosynthetic complex assembly protein PuhC [Rhodothalassiaceae bacterium]